MRLRGVCMSSFLWLVCNVATLSESSLVLFFLLWNVTGSGWYGPGRPGVRGVCLFRVCDVMCLLRKAFITGDFLNQSFNELLLEQVSLIRSWLMRMGCWNWTTPGGTCAIRCTSAPQPSFSTATAAPRRWGLGACRKSLGWWGLPHPPCCYYLYKMNLLLGLIKSPAYFSLNALFTENMLRPWSICIDFNERNHPLLVSSLKVKV